LVALVGVVQTRFRNGAGWVVGGLAALLVLEGLACAHFVWKVPVSPWGRVFDEPAHAVMTPNQGSKAAGYVVRQWIEAAWRQDPKLPVVVHAGRYTMSFAVFSGLNAGEAGWVFHREFGPDRPLSLRPLPPILRVPPAPDSVYLLDVSGKAGSRVVLGDCLRYTIRPASPRNGTAVVYVRPLAGLAPPVLPGDVEMEALEARYDRDYNRYTDYFPRRLAGQ